MLRSLLLALLLIGCDKTNSSAQKSEPQDTSLIPLGALPPELAAQDDSGPQGSKSADASAAAGTRPLDATVTPVGSLPSELALDSEGLAEDEQPDHDTTLVAWVSSVSPAAATQTKRATRLEMQAGVVILH